MAKLVILLCLAAVVASSMAINCYLCQGAECKKAKNQWRQQSCDTLASSRNQKAVCLTQIIIDNGLQMFDHRCIIVTIKDNKPFHKCSEKQEVCEICETDLCNSVTIENYKNDYDNIKIKNLFPLILNVVKSKQEQAEDFFKFGFSQ